MPIPHQSLEFVQTFYQEFTMKKSIICALLFLLSACSDSVQKNDEVTKNIQPKHDVQKTEAVKDNVLKKNAKITQKIDETTGLIVDKGWGLVAGQCGICHSVKLVTQNSGNREHWLSLIRWMQETQNLWPIPKETEDQILDYLAKNYGEKEASRRANLNDMQMPPETPLAAKSPEVIKAQKLLKPFKMNLMKALKTGIQSGGPQKALQNCKLQAPEILKVQQKNGVRMGRSSHKLRNTDNIMPKWAEKLNRSFKNAQPKAAYLTASLSDGRIGYVEPIFVQPLCLACHGQTIDTQLSAQIKASYPNDMAAGFVLGEYRGLFWLELPKALESLNH